MNRAEKRERDIWRSHEHKIGGGIGHSQKEVVKRLKLPQRQSIYAAYYQYRRRVLKENSIEE
jgi:hypothetical protein